MGSGDPPGRNPPRRVRSTGPIPPDQDTGHARCGPVYAPPVRVESFLPRPLSRVPGRLPRPGCRRWNPSVTFSDPGSAPAGLASPQQRFAAHLERALDWEPDGVDAKNDVDVDIRGFIGIDADLNSDEIRYRKIWCRRIEQVISSAGAGRTILAANRSPKPRPTNAASRMLPALGDVCRVAGKVGFVIEVEEVDRRMVEFVHEVTLRGALPEDIEAI